MVALQPQVGTRWDAWGDVYEVVGPDRRDGEEGVRLKFVRAPKAQVVVILPLFWKHATRHDDE
jgi:hypothetical protein